MTELILPTEPKSAMYVVCFFLAQSGEPHIELGFDTQTAAFDAVGCLFGVPSNTVKNERDAFDHFTDSHREGWKKRLAPRLQNTFETYASAPRAQLKTLAIQIMQNKGIRNMDNTNGNSLFDRVVSEDNAPTKVRPPSDGITVEFSNTGIRSNGWFVLTVEQILSVLDDLLENRSIITSETGEVANYDEAKWRQIFDKQLSDDVAKTMGKVQTLPLFELLSKIIHFSKSNNARIVKTLELDEASLTGAKKELNDWWTEISSEPTNAIIGARSFKGGENVIFYGAPGTGKSNKIDREVASKGKKPFRTVFHPDLQNSDFFGCLKPQMNGKKVSYNFAPGPFMEALAEAYSKPNEPVYLVIEELNRAAAAAVFGDLFLLLDRDDDGAGEYDVSFPSPESRAWFKRETGADHDRLRLPSNLFIYATMNSADQGVYPIDTAFRRRWRQEYLPLDYASGPDGDIGYTDVSGASHMLPWRKFVELLNNYLIDSKTSSIAEDRLLGQWFVKQKELNSGDIPEKVLIYLWDDLLRHEGRELIFNTSKIKTYGALAKATTDNLRFLSDGFIAELDAVSKPKQETPLEVGDVSG